MTEAMRYCNVPDHVAHAKAGWSVRPIKWAIIDRIPGVPDDVVYTVTAEELAKWSAVADLDFEYTEVASQAQILITFRDIDGPFGVLAEAELPYGQRQCRLWFDREAWTTAARAGQGQVPFRLVDSHELGHTLGLGHITGRRARMNPVLDVTILELQTADIEAIQALYGKRRLSDPTTPTKPTSPVPPTPGGSMQNWLVQLALNAAKAWLAQKLADGSLQKWLGDLMSGLATGKVRTPDDLFAHVEQITFKP